MNNMPQQFFYYNGFGFSYSKETETLVTFKTSAVVAFFGTPLGAHV